MVKKKNHSLQLIYFVLLIGFIFAFMLHWHSVDMCANVMTMNAELEAYDIYYYESNVQGDLLNPIDCYKRGMIFSMLSFVGLSLLAVCGGFKSERD